MGLLLFLIPGVALAAPATLKGAQDTFTYGDYTESARLCQELLDGHLLASEADLVEAYRIAGLSNFYLNHTEAARKAFVSLLSLEPDYALDAFLFPPAAVAFFDGVKHDNQGPLDLIRAQRKAVAEQERLAEEARKHLFEEQLRRQVEPDRPVLVERVEKRTYALNYFPLGAGQFQEDRYLLGGIFGGAQVVSLATAMTCYFYIDSLSDGFGHYSNTHLALGGTTNFALANQVAVAKWISLGVLGAAYLGGIIDSLTHYEGSVSRIEALPQPQQRSLPGQPPPAAPASGPAAPAPSATPAAPSTSLHLTPWVAPSSGGLAMSLTF